MPKLICSYGCGNKAIVEYQNGKQCCSTNIGKCPAIVKKRTQKRLSTGWRHTQQTKDKLSGIREGKSYEELVGQEKATKWKKNLTGRTAWNKGLSISEDRKKKQSRTMKNRKPWNKGLTAKDADRVARYAKTQTGVPKNHSAEGMKRIRENGFRSFSGSNNPWYGKARSKELSPRYKGEVRNSEFRRYRSKVDILTRKIYRDYEHQINPDGYIRARAGTPGAYHLDHIISAKEGFSIGLPPEAIADKRNLRMIPWRDNIIKYDKIENILLLETLSKDYNESKSSAAK